MDNPNFLQYFWDLGSYDERVSISSIEGVVKCLDSSIENLDNTNKKENQVKTIISFPEINNGRNDLEYTISRLIKGLESQRECVRRGYSACLSIILKRYSIPISNVLEGLEKHYLDGIKKELKGKANSGIAGEIRDRIIALILGYLAIIKSGFFRTNKSRPYIEQTIENLWMLYEVKLYFQDLICEVLYLIVKDISEYDPKLPIKYISNKISNIFDSRVLQTETSDKKRNQLASQIPKISLFLRIRLFLEHKNELIFHGVNGFTNINQASSITINNANNLDEWNKLMFSPIYPFLNDRWDILLSNIQLFTCFSPRIPNLFNSLIIYISYSKCLNDEIALLLISDIISTIEEKYFSGIYSTQKYVVGASMILKLFVQLKYSAFASAKSNINEKNLSEIIKQFFYRGSKCLDWIMKTSLIEKNSLSSFSILFIQTLVDIIKGKDFSIKSQDNNEDSIQKFSNFVFGSIENEFDKKSKFSFDLCIENLTPYLLNETITQLLWNNVNISEDKNTPDFNELVQSFKNQLITSNGERAKLFWKAMKLLLLRTGPRMKFVIRILSELLLKEDLDEERIIISQGLSMIEEISNENLKTGIEEHNRIDELETEDDEKTIVNNSWRKIQWIHNVLLEFIQISFHNSKNNYFSLISKFSQYIPLFNSIICKGSSEEDWCISYRQIIYPRLEKILANFTDDIINIIEKNFETIIEDDSFLNYMEKYNKKLLLFVNKSNNSINKGQDLFDKDLEHLFSKRKIPKEIFKLYSYFIENCLMIFYAIEDFESKCMLNLLKDLIKNHNKKTKLNLIMNFILKLDVVGEGYEEDKDYSPNCLSGLNLLFQLYMKFLDIPNNLEIDLFIQFSQKISQLPDLWNVNSHLIDDENEESDDSSLINDEEKLSRDNEPEVFNQKENLDNSIDESDFEDNIDNESNEDYVEDDDKINIKDNNEINSEDHKYDNEDDKDEFISSNDNSFFSHLLSDDQLPPKYEKQKEQKELERQQIQRINNEMQNKLRMLEILFLISEYLNSSNNEDVLLPQIRSIILLLEGYRIGCKHALYYSLRSTLTIFSDYVKKLAYTINKMLQGISKTSCNLNSTDLGDLFKLLIHIISKPIIEPQTINRWTRKTDNKQLKSKIESYSRQIENLSINIINLMIILDFKNDQLGKIFSEELIRKWITQKRFGIINSSYLTKLMHRIRNIDINNSTNFIIKYYIMCFENTIKYAKGYYQLREYVNLINQAIISCEINFNINTDNRDYIQSISQVILKMIDCCIRNTENEQEELTDQIVKIKFNTNIQKLELLKSLISLSKSIIFIVDKENDIHKLLKNKMEESNNYLNNYIQVCNSGKIKRQINKLKNIIENDRKRIRVS